MNFIQEYASWAIKHLEIGESVNLSQMFNGYSSEAKVLLFAVSKLIGYAIILSSAVVKLPQMQTIIRSNSVQGLSLFGLAMETIGLSIISNYSYKQKSAFSTYGDAVFLVLQNLILLVLFIRFANSNKDEKRDSLPLNQILVLALVIFVNYASFNLFTIKVLRTIMTALLPLMILGFAPQIIENYKNKSIGQMSRSSLVIGYISNFARILTILIELDDNGPLIGCSMAFFFNTILVVQMLMYGNNKNHKHESKKNNAPTKSIRKSRSKKL